MNYYQSMGGGGGGGSYGRGAGRGYGGGGGGMPPGQGHGQYMMGHPPHHPQQQQSPPRPQMMMGQMGDPRDRDPMMMRGGRGGGGYEQDNRGYDYDMGEPSHRGGGPPQRMVPPPSNHPSQGGDPLRAPQQPQSTGPLPGAPGYVKYANDCEIIVTAKAQQQYAEMIEKAIKEFRLKVDIMFPKADVKLAAFIENIASMGTIFAVVIRPDNEAHRSVSVHVLRGCPKPEEHRNMPLTAAYQLIKDRYTEIKRREVGVVPDNMKAILRSLLEEQTLPDKQYHTIIKFLQDRRRKQKAFENRTNNIVGDGSADDDLLNNPDAEELKQRIVTILNGQSTTASGERLGDLMIPRPKEPLKEAMVQSAINNLMQPDLSQKSLNSGGPLPQHSGRGMGRGHGYGRGGGGY